MKGELYDIGIVGGAGHVGAPLAMVLASRGYRVLIHDVNREALGLLAEGHLPFRETGGEELLAQTLKSGRLGFGSDASALRDIPEIIITIGTPVDEFHHPATQSLVRCLDEILPSLSPNTCLILRSTLPPGCTEFLDRHIQSSRLDLLLAYCPERVTEGNAIAEIQSLAQIVSGTSREAQARACAIFSKLAPEIVDMTPLEAEYAKLICNVHRYIQFAAANQFYMLLESAGLSYDSLLGKMKQGYPRMAQLARAGFAAGPCLMKDTLQLGAVQRGSFPLGQIALSINEGMPDFVVNRLKQLTALAARRVGILGMAFKAESDDTRGSLSYRLAKLLHFQGADVRCSDEYVTEPDFVSKEALVDWAEVLIFAVPHRAYRNLAIPADRIVLDTCHAR